MRLHRQSLPEQLPDIQRERSRRARYRRAGWLLLAAVLGVLAILFLSILVRETPLEAGSGAPFTQPIPQPEMALEPPPLEVVPPDAPAPDVPQIWSIPGNEAASPADESGRFSGLSGPSYIGPHAPEFTGSPAPAEAGLVNAELFGHPVLGLHPELLRLLRQVELSSAASTPEGQPPFGVEMIVAYRKGSRAHSQGLAVDLNYYANPYIMHEQGERKQDERLADVYHRVARLMLGRDSVIPVAITEGSPESGRTLRLYRALRDESRAMITYFRLMQDREALARFLAAENRPGAGDPDTLRRQMARDYVTLSGRAGPPAPGLEYPAPDSMDGDPPFAGDPVYRGPELGFLNLQEELVLALTAAGLRWGGTDMGANSGDLMHFYLPAADAISAGR